MWLLIALLACSDPKQEVSGTAPPAGDWANIAPAKVTEVLRGEGRAYLNIEEGPYKFWVSIPDTQVKVGDFLLLGKGPLVENQKSAAAGRSFPELTIIEKVAVVDEATAQAAIRLPVPEGGVDIAGLYTRRKELAGQEVKVRGRVVRVSRNVFETNWVHLQDGTRGAGEGEHDLTVTTTADIPVGAVVVASGPLTIDLDMGFGYFYSAILKEAKVEIESASPSGG